MILYNMPYRGPYEYDKLVLNVLQFYNEMRDAMDSLAPTDMKSLEEIDRTLETMVNTAHSLLNSIYDYEEATR